MPVKEDKRLRVGILGAGQIAQAAHFEGCAKARNADLFAICDVADDLRERMMITHGAVKGYADYETMLADPDVDAVIIATADAFHVPASIRALEAGKHVLCEKPVGVTVEEVDGLAAVVRASQLTFQIGHMKRFDPGLQAAKAFVDEEMGSLIALKAWYCDSTHRYAHASRETIPRPNCGATTCWPMAAIWWTRHVILAAGSKPFRPAFLNARG
jgi:predicted dehydrogenase